MSTALSTKNLVSVTRKITNLLPKILPEDLTRQLAPIVPFMLPYVDQKLLSDFYKDHVAAVTGAGSGMGRSLALKLASLGCHLALSDINSEGLAETHSLLKDYDIKVSTTQLDVADKGAVYEWADQVVEEHGQVNFIFNNAGVTLFSTVEGESIEDIEWVMNINFWGMVYGTKAFLPLIKQSVKNSGGKQNGHIINVSSLFGMVAQPSQSAYNASKFAIRGFNESLRQELQMFQDGISLTSVHPGGVRTNIANNAKGNDSIATLGMHTGDKALKQFNKFLRFNPDTAATIILMAAVDDLPRCLVGDDAKIIDLVQRVFPGRYAQILQKHPSSKEAMKRMTQNQVADEKITTFNP